MTDAAAKVQEYARQFNDTINGQVPVASPLGAWLLVASLATATTGTRRTELEQALGMDAWEASALASNLMEHPHPAVAAALAAWVDPAYAYPAYHEWVASAPRAFQHGPVPSKEAADQWTRERTHDLIQEFPLENLEDVAIVIVSALATDVRWSNPHRVVDAKLLGGPLGEGVTTALASGDGMRDFLADTPGAGRVAVHVAESDNGLRVASVIAEAGHSPRAVQAAAHEVLAALSGRHIPGLVMIPAGQVPLGEGHAWTCEQVRGQEDSVSAIVPAWRLEGKVNDPLLKACPGVSAACSSLERLAFTDGNTEAVQVAVAEYDTAGFKAAAVTAFAAPRGGIPQMGDVRHTTLRMNRPHAVVASAVGGAWDGVPVFAAWVDKAKEATPA